MKPFPLLRSAAAALLFAGLLEGCVVHAHAPAPEVVVFGPPRYVTRARHFHGPGCGHAARWHSGRWVYWSSERWEYVEGGSLYVYRTVTSHPRGHVVRERAPARRRSHPRERDRGRDRDDRIQRYEPDDR